MAKQKQNKGFKHFRSSNCEEVETMENKLTVYSTTKYEQFKRLKGNRDVTNKRVAIIKESLTQIGYISNPIIVNEHMEIIDGQGRLEALRQLEMPVEYRVINGLGITECRAMNLKPTSWSISDFIKSYAEYGNENYIRLKNIADKYGIGYSLPYSLCKNLIKSGRRSQDELRNGTLYFDEETAKKVDALCEYLAELKNVQKKIGGRGDVFFGAVGWIAMQDGVDKDRLKISILQQYNMLTPTAKVEPTLKELSEIYNKGYPRGKRRFFDYEWKTQTIN